MAALHKLIDVTGRKSDGALATWQRLRAQCDEALAKLSLLRQHRQRYRDLLNTDLRAGMPAGASVAYLGFIGQIDEVVLRQEAELRRLEAACARKWQELTELRREKRTYEIALERTANEELAAALRHSQREIDDLLQRVGHNQMAAR